MQVQDRKRGWGTLPPFFILFTLLVLFFSDIIFSGKTLSTSLLLPGTTPDGPYSVTKEKTLLPFTFDLSGNAWINEPNPYIIKRQISNGSSPLWNTDEGLGMPLLANPNTEVLNPLKLFLHIYPAPFLHDVFYLLRLFLMGIFTYLFLKKRNLSNLSSLFGATSFMLSGYSTWWINLHPLSSEMYIPALFYFYETFMSQIDTKDNENNPTSPPFSKGWKGGFPAFFFSLFLALSISGGKPHVIIMGLILLFIYAICRDITGHRITLWQRLGVIPVRLTILIISGILLASVLILPFAELLKGSSLIAKQVRTGASSHTLPLISSITIWQPLFLGIKNYFYGSWLKWSPFYMVPYAGIMVLLLYIYAVLRRNLLITLLPFSLFSLFLFLKIYGVLPNDLLIGIPILGSTNFIKYHGMLFFSLSIISAHSIEDMRKERSLKLYLAIILTSAILIIYFFFLKNLCPPEKVGYITKVLIVCLGGLFITGLFFYLSGVKGQGSKKFFVSLLFLLMIAELYINLPKEHPERIHPYKPPPYLKLISDSHPYRIIGNGNVIPPVISSAIGLHDLRGINVLIPNDYYLFFENLISFSVPYTNDPSPLMAGTSPISDLLGVKYILSNEKIDINRLQDALRQHLLGLRTIRYLNEFKSHGIKGSNGYGYFESGGERRFSFFFKPIFRFSAKVRITEPRIFISATILEHDMPESADIDIRIEKHNHTLKANSSGWNDTWIDVSKFMGKTVKVVIESNASKKPIAIGGFGLSKGKEWEDKLLNKLYINHLEEYKYLEYKGHDSGIHIYENKNVMPRAFILHETKPVNSLREVISELQDGVDFRRVALISGHANSLPSPPVGEDKGEEVTIKRYLPTLVKIDVKSGGGILVLSDLYYPGWKVKVNGKESKIIRTFGTLRGVLVPEGESSVIFSYKPISLYAGIGISLLTLGLWLILLIKKGH